MVLTKRQKDILIYLCSKRGYITIKQLAMKFNVSNRTIQNDLAFIDSFLSNSKVIIDRKSSKGIKVIANEPEISNLRQKLKSLKYRALDNYERLSIISLLLLCNPINTFEQLSSACDVSRQTIINSFQQIEDNFIKEGIEIHKIKGIGIKITGDEIRIRKYFESKLSESIQDEVILSVVVRNSKLMEFDKIANEIIESVENKLNIQFIEFMKIKLLLDYSLYRIGNGHALPADKCTNIKEIKDYKGYEPIISALSDFEYSISDKLYFCSLFMNAKISDKYSENLKAYKDSIDEARMVSEYLFNKLQAIQPLAIDSKERFIHGLTLHLRVAIYRIRNKIPIHNEFLTQIKISMPLIYEFTKKELLKCEKEFDIAFDENEIAFIAMYIASAYENSFKTESKLAVLLVCSFGIATSSILKTKILQAIPFECNIIGPMSERDADDYLSKNEVNLIISTNEYHAKDIPIITVNPLLFPEDIDYIKSRLFQLSYSMMCTHFIKSCANFGNEKGGPTYIKDYVVKENIQIVDTCKTWADAIKLAAKPLLDKGKIEQRYVNRMIEAVEQFGTYMVFEPETAFIHAGTEDGINENCTAILVLRNPIIFGNKNSKIVRNLVVLGIKNKDEDSLLKFIYIFENKLNLSNLASKKITIDAIYNMHD